MKNQAENFVSTTNSCKLCSPLGACLAFRGIEGSVPFLHGSQGCATYMRRYIISHFREPMDIASSSLGEKSAVYGGGPNLKLGLKNIMSKYNPQMVGIATTCLTETIGDDTPRYVKEFRDEFHDLLDHFNSPDLVTVSTPSYSGAHMDGFHAAVRSVVDQMAGNESKVNSVNIFPGFISPADTRYLKEIIDDLSLKATILPDLSETLDAPALSEYEKLPSGGTKRQDIWKMGGALCSLEFGRSIVGNETPGALLLKKFQTPLKSVGAPIGLRESDLFFEALEEISGTPMPEKYALERGRLIDSYIDGHKYVFGLKAVVYGEEDMVIGLTSFLAEIGVKPALVATGAKGRRFRSAIENVCEGILNDPPIVLENVDFYDIANESRSIAPDLLIGNSKGYRLARELGAPLIRVGFPVHDRFGGHRLLSIGYRGAQNLFDTIVNTVIQQKQDASDIGYGYI